MKFRLNTDVPEEVLAEMCIDEDKDLAISINGMVVAWIMHDGRMILRWLSDKDKENLQAAGISVDGNNIFLEKD